MPRLGVEICSGRRRGTRQGDWEQGQLRGGRAEEEEATVEEKKELRQPGIWKAGSAKHAAAAGGARADHVASKSGRRRQEEARRRQLATHSHGC